MTALQPDSFADFSEGRSESLFRNVLAYGIKHQMLPFGQGVIALPRGVFRGGCWCAHVDSFHLRSIIA